MLVNHCRSLTWTADPRWVRRGPPLARVVRVSPRLKVRLSSVESSSSTTVRIGLYEPSSSFAAIWASLASDLGVQLERTADLDRWMAQPVAIRLAAVGGAEDEFAGTLARMPDAAGVAVVGADPDHRLAMMMIKAGATEYFALPGDLEVLRSWVAEQVEGLRRAEARKSFAAGEEAKYRFEGMLGQSAAHRRSLATAARVIPRPSVTVLITGETGTGKELLARAIHYNGPRREAPFVDVNCAAIPEQLLESELFGHEKGAFTDATSAKPGLFEVANHGTVFLDEIGHLPLPLQGKLLRALEQRSIRRVGGTGTMAIDVRVIAATHVNLQEAVRRGEFREDLYYRLNVLPIELPPLRTREDDVVLLANHFLTRFAGEYQMTAPRLTPAAEERLRSHGWDGNVRELRNVIERSLLLHQGDTMGPDDLSIRASTAAAHGSSELPFPTTLIELNRNAARAMVERCRGNKSEAARRLAISRTRLLRLLDAHHLDDSEEGLE